MGMPNLRLKLLPFFGDILATEYLQRFARSLLLYPNPLFGVGISLKTAKILACCLLVFPLVGTVPRSGPKTREQSLDTHEDIAPRRAAVSALLHETTEIFRAGRYHEALQQFEAALLAANQAHLPDLAARAVGDVGACQFALHQYRPALQSFLEAHRQCEAAGDTSAAAAFEVNIASLYSELGELDSAAQWMQNSMGRVHGKDREVLPKILIQLATLRARQDRMPEALQIGRA